MIIPKFRIINSNSHLNFLPYFGRKFLFENYKKK
nr:MAG TPA: hypothetical protein [Caudoviricetes sp.]